MDTAAALRAERDALIRADLDIRMGEDRLLRQQELMAEMTNAGQDLPQAERLLELLRETLAGWKLHRQLIVERIAYLELRSSIA